MRYTNWFREMTHEGEPESPVIVSTRGEKVILTRNHIQWRGQKYLVKYLRNGNIAYLLVGGGEGTTCHPGFASASAEYAWQDGDVAWKGRDNRAMGKSALLTLAREFILNRLSSVDAREYPSLIHRYRIKEVGAWVSDRPHAMIDRRAILKTAWNRVALVADDDFREIYSYMELTRNRPSTGYRWEWRCPPEDAARVLELLWKHHPYSLESVDREVRGWVLAAEEGYFHQVWEAFQDDSIHTAEILRSLAEE